MVLFLTWEAVVAAVVGAVAVFLGGACLYRNMRPMGPLLRMLAESGSLIHEDAKSLFLFSLLISRSAILICTVVVYAWAAGWVAVSVAAVATGMMVCIAIGIRCVTDRRMRRSEAAGGAAVWRH